MTISPRMRIAKSGKSVFSTDPRDFVLDERYNMFKYHSTSTTSVDLTAGSTENSATVAHNLGYVPAFLVYYQRSDESVERLVPSLPFGVGFDIYPWAYATSTGIVVGVSSSDPYNQLVLQFSDYWNDYDSLNDHWSAGKTSFTFGGAFRFTGVTLTNSQTITSASLDIGVTAKGVGAGNVLMKHYGIDEDNTADFSSYPMGRTKTTAYEDQSHSPSTPPYSFGVNVKSMVEEIISRPGWASGNAMGFITFDNGSGTDTWVVARDSTNTLTIVTPGTLTVSFRVVIFKDKISP